MRFLVICLATLLAPQLLAEESSARQSAPKIDAVVQKSQPARVVVIPIEGPIARPLLYIVRRGMKEAIEADATAVVLNINTPGGEMGVTLEIMEALEKFPGETIAYVNREAMSAGAFISAASDEIYFAPGSIIGAAAPVTSGGGEIDKTMREKLVSYMKGKVRSVSEGKGYRGEVVSAMIDTEYELKIGEKIIKEKGSLLTLTANEAMETYGDPAETLLGAGIAEDLDALLNQKFGKGNHTQNTLEITWSEELAVVLNGLAPILMGLGLLGLFIEFKTPGFGIFGVGGGLLLAIVFLGHFVAGFSGHEPMLIFALGVVLVALELFLLPGTVVLALSGIIMMLGSLLWSMADIWPNEPLTISGELFFTPMLNLALGVLVAIFGAVVLVRFLPKGWFWDKMILQTVVAGEVPEARDLREESPLVGKRGVAATDLFPSGQVEIEGRRYEAKVAVGSIDAGQSILVVAKEDFDLLVEAVDEEGKV